jgi:hypothetical protein
MTDAEARWLACTEPKEMLRDSERKLRLFAVACCRRFAHLLPKGASRQAVEVAERFADEKADRDELVSALSEAVYALPAVGASDLAANAAKYAALPSARAAAYAVCEVTFIIRQDAGRAWQCDLLREIFGHPYRPVTIERAWRASNDGAVIKLAQAIYDDRNFAHLPVLGDALEDAGCRDELLLDHCRGRAEHLRGCWLLDLLLGRE